MLIALLFAVFLQQLAHPPQQQLQPPTAVPVDRWGSSGAVYGTFWVLAGDTLVVNIEDPVPPQYGSMWADWSGHCTVNGMRSAQGGGGRVELTGSQVTIVGNRNDCVVDVKGYIARCTGPGCPDLSRHWAADPTRRVTSEWRPGALGRVVYNLVGTGLGWWILMAWLAGWVGLELMRAILRVVGYYGDEDEDEEADDEA